MTLEREKAIKMLKAKLECMTRDVSGCDDDCNRKLCGECHLNYEQGNMGEQKECLRMSIEALKAQKVGKWDVESDCEGKTRTLIHKECGFKSNPYAWKDYNFCPECGARMGVENE